MPVDVLVPKRVRKRNFWRFECTKEALQKVEDLAAKNYPIKYIAISLGVSGTYWSDLSKKHPALLEALERGRVRAFEKLHKTHEEIMEDKEVNPGIRLGASQWAMERFHGCIKPPDTQVTVDNSKKEINIAIEINGVDEETIKKYSHGIRALNTNIVGSEDKDEEG